MSKFLSGRQSNLKLGISGYTESKTVLQTTGKVGIGTTDAQNFSLFVVGPTNITDTLTVAGQNVTGVATFSGSVNYPDNVVVSWGDSQDLKVYHDSGGQSYIKDTGTGDLNLTSDGTGIHFQSSGGSTLARFYSAGPSEIHHVGSRKLHTTTGGVEVTGLTDTDSLNVSGQSTFNTVNVTGVSTFTNNVEITGDLTVSGTRTFLNTTELEVQDINIGIASAIPKLSNAALDGAGITIYGNAGDKSLTWNNANSRMEFNTDLYSPNFFVGGITASGLIDANGGIDATTAKVEDLTDNRIVVVGVGGELEDDANLTFNGSELNVGSAITAYAATGIVSATAFYGDGSNLQNTGATLSATSGTERLVTTQLTSGTMVNASTDADLTFNATDNLLHTPKIDVAGLSPDGTTFGASGYVPLADGAGGWSWANLQGASSVNTILNGFTVSEEGVVVGTAGSITQLDFRGVNVLASADTAPNGIATVTIALNQSLDSIDVGGISTFRGLVGNGVTFGSQGQYLEATGIGITWKNFPTLRTTQTNTATAGQTAFNFTYNIDFLDVFVNGVKLSSSEYTATNGNQVVLDTPAFVGETVEFHSYNVASTYSGGGGGGGASNLNGLTDVTIGTLADNQLLQYNSSSGEWENVAVTSLPYATEAFVGLSTAGLASETFVGLSTAGLASETFVGLATAGLASETFVGLSTAGLLSSTGDASNLTNLTGASAATYGSSNTTPQIIVDSNGRITDISNVLISGGGGGGGTSIIINDSGSVVGTAGTIDFGSGLSVTPPVAGIVTVTTDVNLTNFSVTTNSVGTAALSYNNSNGVFSYTPPDLSSYLTSYTETDTLASVTGRGSSTNTNLTFGGGLTVTGVSTFQNQVVANGEVVINGGFDLDMAGGGDLDLTEGGVLKMGAGGVTNLEIYNNGSVSVISDSDTTGVYGLLLKSTTEIELQKNGTGNEKLATFTPDGPVDLYYDNALKLSTAGTGVTVTGRVDATSFAGDGSALTNLPTTHSDIVSIWTLGASGSSDYTLTGPGLTGAENDPTIYLVRGQTYRFTNNSGGSHPFQIRYNSNGTAYSDGVTNNGASSGNIDFNVQYDAPDVLYYQCTNHSGMLGKIIILGDVVNEGSWTASAGSAQTIDTITGVANNAIKTAEYTIHIENGSNMQAQKVLVMQDGTTAFSQEYAIMHKSGLLVSMSATISGGNLLLQATPETGVSGTTTYKVTRQTMR